MVHCTVTPRYSGPHTIPVFYEIAATGTNPDGSTGLSFSQAVLTSIYSPRPGWKNLGTVTDSRNEKIMSTGATR